MKEVLICDNICKKMGKRVILSNISFAINEGDILGFIGPNGSGKTTLIKLILSLQYKDSGKIYINGYDIDNKYKESIKYVGSIVENPDFYNYMSGKKNLELKARIYNVSKERIEEVIKLVDLTDRINDKVSKYSLGMKQRLGIAYALLNNPKLLILDEPTNGLDIEGIKSLREILKSLSKEGIAIFISSHILSELDNLCNKVCIIKNGKIVDFNEIDKLKHKNNNNTYIFYVSDTSDINLLFDNEIINNNSFKVTCNKEFIPIIVESLVKYNIKIYEIKEVVTTLEDIFLGGENV